MPASRKLERGGVRDHLIRELAKQERTQTELGVEFGVGQPAISEFASRHRDEINAHKARIDDEMMGLWIASKRARVVEYQDDVERINDALESEVDPNMLKAKLAVMRQVAEELGQLKTNVDLSGAITYVVQGVNLEALR